MLVKKTKEQKDYLYKLKNNISSFVVNYKKRYQLFPWSDFNKISKLKFDTSAPITVNGTKFTVKELIKNINKIKVKIQSRLKPSYYNFILKAYIKDSVNKSGSSLKTVYNQYNDQLNLSFKETKQDLMFCLESLKELNKYINKNYYVKESTSEHDKGKFMKDFKDYVKWASMDESIYKRIKPLNNYIVHKTKKDGDYLLLATLFGDFTNKLKENLSNNVLYNGNKVEFHTCYLPGDVFIYIKLNDIVKESVDNVDDDSQKIKFILTKILNDSYSFIKKFLNRNDIKSKYKDLYDKKEVNISKLSKDNSKFIISTGISEKTVLSSNIFDHVLTELNRYLKNIYSKELKEYKISLDDNNKGQIILKISSEEAYEYLNESEVDSIMDGDIFTESINDRLTFIDNNGDVIDINDFILECAYDVNDFFENIEEELVTEGANIDITKKFLKTYIKDIRNFAKIYKTAIKKNDFNTARKAIKNISNEIDKAIIDIKDIKSDAGSAAIGIILRNIIVISKILVQSFGIGFGTGVLNKGLQKKVPAITFNNIDKVMDITNKNTKISSVLLSSAKCVSVISNSISILKEVINQCVEISDNFKDSKNQGDVASKITPDIFNSYKNSIITNLKNMKKSINNMNNAVDKAEEKYKEIKKETKKKEKAVKESTEFELRKRIIYESCQKGEITIDEREDLISELNNDMFIKESVEVTLDETTNREKFNSVRKVIYEKCSNGEISVEEREKLLGRAREIIFNEKAAVPIDATNNKEAKEVVEKETEENSTDRNSDTTEE